MGHARECADAVGFALVADVDVDLRGADVDMAEGVQPSYA
jgi:hypothetical protein